MREQLVLPEAVSHRVAQLLGAPVERDGKYCQLIASAEDHLFIWNESEQNVLAVNLSSRGEDKVQILNLTNCPQHTVTGLVVSSRGERICVYGEDGITAIEVPRRSGSEGRLGGGDAELLCRAFTLYRLSAYLLYNNPPSKDPTPYIIQPSTLLTVFYISTQPYIKLANIIK